MTYNFIKNTAPETNLRFARDTSGLPMDKLRCFWPFRAGGGQDSQVDLMGNAPLAYAPGCTGTKMLWSPSNPSGGQLGSCDFNNSTRANRNGWATSGANPHNGVAQELFATGTTPWAFTGWVRMVDADYATNEQDFISSYNYSENGFIIGQNNTAGAFQCRVFTGLTSGEVSATTTDLFADNTWAFFACGMDGVNAWAVINDGTPTTAACTSGPPTGAPVPIYFGRRYTLHSGRDGNNLDGNLADIAYWYNQGSFTSAQLADLYNSGNGNTLLRG